MARQQEEWKEEGVWPRQEEEGEAWQGKGARSDPMEEEEEDEEGVEEVIDGSTMFLGRY